MQEAKIFQGDEMLQKTQRKFYKQQIKREQLKVAFTRITTELFEGLIGKLGYDNTTAIDVFTNMLLKEVSIRTPLK